MLTNLGLSFSDTILLSCLLTVSTPTDASLLLSKAAPSSPERLPGNAGMLALGGDSQAWLSFMVLCHGFWENGWNGFISGVSETHLEKISLKVLAKLLVYEASSLKQCLNLNCFFILLYIIVLL